MKNRNTYLAIFVLTLLIALVVFLFCNKSRDVIVPVASSPILPYPDLKKSTDDLNEYLQERRREQEQYEKNKTPEQVKKDREYWDRLSALSSHMLSHIHFFGKIIDQYEMPVQGVQVKYSAGNAYLASGSNGLGVVTTNENGIFEINDANGTGLFLDDFEKNNYEFEGRKHISGSKQSDELLAWSDYTKDSPFIIHAWKADKYPIIANGRDAAAFISDGRVYKIDLRQAQIKYGSKLSNGEITVSIEVNEKSWSVVIAAVDGGLIETSERFLNLAPEDGYQAEFTYTWPRTRYDKLNKNYYFKAHNGAVYGAIKMEILPYPEDSSISFDYVTNLEKGRDLAMRSENR